MTLPTPKPTTPEPDTMLICGHRFRVITEDPGPWSSGCLLGMSETAAQMIWLKAGIPDDTRQATLLHEVIHAIARMNWLSFRDNEGDVCVLANALYAWMRDNAAFVAEMAGLGGVSNAERDDVARCAAAAIKAGYEEENRRG